jgi:hypothetical protein
VQKRGLNLRLKENGTRSRASALSPLCLHGVADIAIVLPTSNDPCEIRVDHSTDLNDSVDSIGGLIVMRIAVVEKV